MTAEEQYAGRNAHLPRLDRESYRGQAYVHWILTTEDRRTGWLIPIFYYKFRELLTHAMFRYQIACPLYCLMPDHMHLLWVGIADRSDQINAMKYLRKQLRLPLEKLGVELQNQPYDRVLREDERIESAFGDLAEYIARNPERKGLVAVDQYRAYPYAGCLVPGYPELNPWIADYWTRFWRAYAFVRKNGLFRAFDEDVS